MTTLTLVLIIVAIVLFAIAAIPLSSRVNLVAAGLAVLALAHGTHWGVL